MPTDVSDPAVLVGLKTPDDAAVYRVSEEQAIVQTVDFFTPIVDDPFDWGRIAAANALSDIYAMGAIPVTALNLVGWPRSLDLELLGRVLEGGSDACKEAGVVVLGGHSVEDPEPKYGMAVTGTVHPDRMVLSKGAEPEDDLVLTKPLGTGIISAAVKQQRAKPDVEREAIASMSALNRAASEVMVEHDVSAATDVTGFGLIGHLLEMLTDGLRAEINWAELPVLSGAVELADEGVFPGGSERNLKATKDRVDVGELSGGKRAILFDAQTSGGLLIAVSPARTDSLIAALRSSGADRAARIGRVGSASTEARVRVL
ncbi:MAG: selenide, water dikinase SelD [Actinomycetota bacterium]|nr:selenide, water dikinase SelD [Actinomycetota bacterium]